MTRPEVLKLIIVDILIPIITLVVGFFAGKTYQIKVSNRSNVKVKASGKDSQSAGRDIINGSK